VALLAEPVCSRFLSVPARAQLKPSPQSSFVLAAPQTGFLGRQVRAAAVKRTICLPLPQAAFEAKPLQVLGSVLFDNSGRADA